MLDFLFDVGLLPPHTSGYIIDNCESTRKKKSLKKSKNVY